MSVVCLSFTELCVLISWSAE